MYDLVSLGKAARQASMKLRTSDTNTRNTALCAIAASLRENMPEILEANRLDLATAKAAGIRSVMIDRLTLTAERIRGSFPPCGPHRCDRQGHHPPERTADSQDPGADRRGRHDLRSAPQRHR